MTSPLSPPVGARLKRAVRASIERCGGIDGAAATAGRQRSVAVTGKGKSQHGRFQSAADADCATVDDVAQLEAVAPRGMGGPGAWPPVTRLLCELAGGVFLPLPDAEAHDGPVALGIVTLAKEFGDLAAAAQDGLADGTLAPGELLRIQAEGAELQTALAAFLQQIAQMIEAAPPSVAALRSFDRLRTSGRA